MQNELITVEKVANKPVWKVKLAKKVVGEIRFLIGSATNELPSYHQYFPKGSATGGDKFVSLNDCIKSLA